MRFLLILGVLVNLVFAQSKHPGVDEVFLKSPVPKYIKRNVNYRPTTRHMKRYVSKYTIVKIGNKYYRSLRNRKTIDLSTQIENYRNKRNWKELKFHKRHYVTNLDEYSLPERLVIRKIGVKNFIDINNCFLNFETGGKTYEYIYKISRVNYFKGFWQEGQAMVDELLKNYKGHPLLRGINRWNWRHSYVRQRKIAVLRIYDMSKRFEKQTGRKLTPLYAWFGWNMGYDGLKAFYTKIVKRRVFKKCANNCVVSKYNMIRNLPPSMREKCKWKSAKGTMKVYSTYWYKRINKLNKKLDHLAYK